jgi:hypothetical protein
MLASREALENLLEADLDTLFAGLADDWSSVELYRALTKVRWSKPHGLDGHVSFNGGRSAALVNGLRQRHGKVVLELHLSGGEGEVSERAADMMDSNGWARVPGRFERRAHAGVEVA